MRYIVKKGNERAMMTPDLEDRVDEALSGCTEGCAKGCGQLFGILIGLVAALYLLKNFPLPWL